MNAHAKVPDVILVSGIKQFSFIWDLFIQESTRKSNHLEMTSSDQAYRYKITMSDTLHFKFAQGGKILQRPWHVKVGPK